MSPIAEVSYWQYPITRKLKENHFKGLFYLSTIRGDLLLQLWPETCGTGEGKAESNRNKFLRKFVFASQFRIEAAITTTITTTTTTSWMTKATFYFTQSITDDISRSKDASIFINFHSGRFFSIIWLLTGSWPYNKLGFFYPPLGGFIRGIVSWSIGQLVIGPSYRCTLGQILAMHLFLYNHEIKLVFLFFLNSGLFSRI